MPSVVNKAFENLLIALDQLASGIHKHSDNPKLTANLCEEDLYELKKELKAVRENYLEKEKQARLAYAEFEVKFKHVQQTTSNNIRIVKGILGPKAEELLDFGILPEKSKAPRKFPVQV